MALGARFSIRGSSLIIQNICSRVKRQKRPQVCAVVLHSHDLREEP